MRLSIKTWNGIDIQNSNIAAVIPPGQLTNLTANPVLVPRANQFPFLSTSTLPAHSIVIHIVINGDINTYRDLTKKYFDIQDTIRHDLVAWDLDNANKPWFLRGIPIRVQEINTTIIAVTLQVEMPVWRLVTATDDTWSITASGQTHDVTPIGNVNVPPKFTITPTVAKTGGLSYRRWICVYNNLEVSYFTSLDITNGGLDTATLTPAKMQVDGDDFRVWVDGVDISEYRWLDAMDTAATKCWININLAPLKEGTILTSIASSGSITTITFSESKSNLTFLQTMQKIINKVVLIDTEAFTFTGVNFSTWQLTGVMRAQKGTSMAAHSSSAIARWIEHDIWILYGDATLSASVTNDEFKPMFALNSTNASLLYTQFWDATSARRHSWYAEVNSTRTNKSYTFTANENTFTNPAVEMGLSMNNPPDTTSVQQETAQLDWIYSHPAGITTVTYAGEKYMANTTFPSIAGLQKLEPDSAWITVTNEIAPTAALTWESFSHSSVSLGGTYNLIRFSLDGTLAKLAGDSAMIQFDNITLALDTDNLPTVIVGAEQSVNFFDFKLTNQDTGEFITCKTPCPVNDSLVIDCENKLVYLSNGERAIPKFSSIRQAWLDLLPAIGNTLKFEDAGTNAVTLVTTHRDRNM